MENYPSSWGSSRDEDGGGDGSGVDGEAFRGTSPSGRCRNRDSRPPIWASRWRRLGKVSQKLAEVNERANTLAQKLEQSEEARKKAESDAVQARQEADKAKTDAADVEDLRKDFTMPRLR
ncbi:hypothetical protein QYE76_066366 [Lolium multiflorum]|uniref:Uncharacterized protein n=1 Tax=Lolium multiflorum TaxID=4521 RepID=A0AAD8SAD1_LOLMU|nr:hypothetical protein QYE76_066366 [Lolium multiflorum]